MRRDTRHHHVVHRGNDNFVQKGAFRGRAKIARGCGKSPRGRTQCPRGAQSYRFIRFVRIHTNSYDFVRLLAFGAFSELSYASGQNARRRQTYPRDEKLNRSNQRKVCAAIRDIIMSYVAETTILCKRAHSEGARKSLEGAEKALEGAHNVLEVHNHTDSFDSYEFIRIHTISYDSLPLVHFPELSYASGQNARRRQTKTREMRS